MEGSDGTGSEERFEVVEGVLAVSAPVEDRVFLGQGMQGAGDGCKIFYISPVIPARPRKEQTLVAVLGGGISRMAARSAESDRRPSSVTRCPR